MGRPLCIFSRRSMAFWASLTLHGGVLLGLCTLPSRSQKNVVSTEEYRFPKDGVEVEILWRTTSRLGGHLKDKLEGRCEAQIDGETVGDLAEKIGSRESLTPGGIAAVNSLSEATVKAEVSTLVPRLSVTLDEVPLNVESTMKLSGKSAFKSKSKEKNDKGNRKNFPSLQNVQKTKIDEPTGQASFIQAKFSSLKNQNFSDKTEAKTSEAKLIKEPSIKESQNLTDEQKTPLEGESELHLRDEMSPQKKNVAESQRLSGTDAESSDDRNQAEAETSASASQNASAGLAGVENGAIQWGGNDGDRGASRQVRRGNTAGGGVEGGFGDRRGESAIAREISGQLQRAADGCYPRMAKRRGLEGIALVRFCVDEAGRSTKFALIQSTGSPVLDGAAECVVQKAGTFPQKAVGKCVKFPIRFTLSK